jgi:cell division protein FtsL
MAVIGARPATGIGVLRRRPRPRPRAVPGRRSGPRRLANRRETLTSLSAVLVAIAAAAGLGLFYLSQSTHVAAVGYEIDKLQAQVAQLQAEQQQLTFEIGQARSPSTVADRAQKELQLVPVDPSVVRFASRTIDPHLLK